MGLQTLTDNGSTASITAKDKVHVHLSGGFGGGSVALEFLPSGGSSWIAISGAAWSAAADEIVELAGRESYNLRLTLSGATTPALVTFLAG